MKVMFIAVFSPTSTNNSQSRGFKRAGCKVIEYNYREIAKRLGPTGRDNDLVKVCKKEKPDLVLFSKCNAVHIDVIKECNKICKTALWYMDPMGNFNKELKDKIKYCTHTFCALQKPMAEARKYSKNVHFLHEGFDPDVDRPHDVPYKYNATFIGNLRGDRGHQVVKLGLRHLHGIFGEAHAKVVSESRINVNFVDNNAGASDRVYKIMAAGGFLLTQPWPNMDFEPDVHLATYSTLDEGRMKIQHYLNNPDQRTRIAAAGHREVQKYNRDNWAKRILEMI